MNKKELRALITIAGKVDPSLQTAMLKAAGESGKAANKIGARWKALGAGLKSGAASVMQGIGAGVLALAVAAAAAFAAMGAQGLKYASDLEEVQNVVSKTFEENTAVIDSFAESSLEAYGLTTLEAKRYSSTMGAMLKSMGLTGEETLVMSQNLTALAGDMASFYNLTGDEAFEKIRSGISGETEPLKQLGINMSVANMEAYALSQGIQKSYSAMTQAEQAALRYNYLLSVTSDAQGDFTDTSDSFANQQKLLKANLQQTAGEIMTNMMPALASAMKEANRFIKSLDTEAIGRFVGGLGEMAVAFMPLVADLMPVFGDLLSLLMPPLIEIGQQIIPIVVQVVQTLMAALAPLIPPIVQFVEALMPPLMKFFTAVSPLISTLAELLGGVLGGALQIVQGLMQALVEVFTIVADPIEKMVAAISSLFSSQEVATVSSTASGILMTGGAAVHAYAAGGFSDRPAIFGEAGLEAAIPIKPGSARSLGLLRRTAELLGAGGQYANDESRRSVNFTYAPVIHAESGEDDGKLERLLRSGYNEMKRMIKEFFIDKGRFAWE